MAEVILFHSVLGIREGVLDAAERMELMGHTVHIPNLYEAGAVFDDYDQASAYVQSKGGYPALLERTREAVRTLPADAVYAGFSQGGASAEFLAATRPSARGVVLFASAVRLHWFDALHGSPVSWPSSVPVQVHYAVNDPFREQEELDGFAESVGTAGAPFTLYEYPGRGHLFTDETLPHEYDEAATSLLWQRVAVFLQEIEDANV